MSRYHVIFNARSGTVLSRGITVQSLQERFREAGLTAVIDADVDRPMDERLREAMANDADIVVAAGGDGTVTGVAGALAGTDKAMAILPLGTVNLLARDLAIPLELDEWMARLTAMAPRRIDVGEVNGQIFLHKVVAGVVPGIAAGREQIRGRDGLGAKIGFVQFFFRRLLRVRRMAIDIAEPDRPARQLRVAALAVANNAYDEGPGCFFSRQRLDRGHLTIYLIRRLGVGDVARLATKMVLGHWRADEALEIEPTRGLTLRTSKARLQVMLDGEVESLATPLHFRIRPQALTVMAPPVAEEAAASPAGTETSAPSPAGAALGA